MVSGRYSRLNETPRHNVGHNHIQQQLAILHHHRLIQSFNPAIITLVHAKSIVIICPNAHSTGSSYPWLPQPFASVS